MEQTITLTILTSKVARFSEIARSRTCSLRNWSILAEEIAGTVRTTVTLFNGGAQLSGARLRDRVVEANTIQMVVENDL